MTPAANLFPASRRTVFGMTETLLRLALWAAIPISAVVFVALSF